MNRLIPLAAALALSGCATSTTLSPTDQTAVGAAQTLTALAAANNKTVAAVLNDGQLICQNPLTGLFLAAVEGATSPTSIIGIGARDVATACPLVAGVQTLPAPLPATVDPATVPAVPAAAVLPVQS